MSEKREKRPKGRTVCAHCGRKRLPKFIEWHPGIEAWQCSDFTDCDLNRALRATDLFTRKRQCMGGRL